MILFKNIPRAWNLANLKDVSIFQEGPGVRKWQFRNDGIKLINVRNLVDDNLVLSNTSKHLDTTEVKQKYSHFLLNEGDFVVASSGVTWGKIAEVNKNNLPLCLNTSVIRFVSKDKEILSKRYLWHFIKSIFFRRQIDRLITGSAQPNFGPSHLKKIKIPLPPLDIQKKIATVLDKTDQLRQKRKETIEKLDQLIQSVFLDLFGDPVTNPKGWEKKSGSQYCDTITVGVVVKPASYYVENGVPALRSLNIRKNKIELDNLVFFSKESNENKLKKSQLKTDDVLIVRSGQPGTAATLPEKLNGINCIDLIIARPKKSIITPIYLSHFFNSEGGKMLVMSSEKGQIQKHLNIGEVKKSLIPVPPIDIQDNFSKQIRTIEKQKQNLHMSLGKIDNLFNSLLQRAFKGELKFNDNAFKDLEEVMN